MGQGRAIQTLAGKPQCNKFVEYLQDRGYSPGIKKGSIKPP